MSKISIEVEEKDTTKNPRQLRAAGKLPATIYGKGMDSISVQLDAHNFIHTYKNNKEATYELSLSGKMFKKITLQIKN